MPPAVVGEGGFEDAAEAQQSLAAVARQTPDPGAFAALLATTQALSSVPLYKDSRTDLLIDGPATYAAMHQAIESARKYIHLETYIFADDEVGRKFAEALLRKAQAGVEVRVIYDSIGSGASSSDFFESMERGGVELIEYHNINPVEGGNPLKANNRSHRKLLVVDGRVAFTGGLNLSSQYASSSRDRASRNTISQGWRDTHVAIRGPAVEGFELAFEEQWALQGGSLAEDPLAGVTFEAAGNDMVAVLQAEGGDGEVSPIYHAYLEAMRTAVDRIWITQAYFSPDDVFIEHINKAAARGVDVRLLVPGQSDWKLLLNASRSRYHKLLEHGVKIHESRASILHAKTAVIDGTWSTVGSSNLDYRSFLHNDEINAIIMGTDFARQMEAQFLDDLENSQEVTLEGWSDRPLGDRIKERFSWMFAYWL